MFCLCTQSKNIDGYLTEKIFAEKNVFFFEGGTREFLVGPHALLSLNLTKLHGK